MFLSATACEHQLPHIATLHPNIKFLHINIFKMTKAAMSCDVSLHKATFGDLT